ncbi:hypothetical protein WHR41_06566 [Cladosporium halotolerans]|uniref:Uncharacterized protein n=1 Tax=Cladosporium halotolerans TaxID=1052096 RepID=A0AB34KM57_9PEZI
MLKAFSTVVTIIIGFTYAIVHTESGATCKPTTLSQSECCPAVSAYTATTTIDCGGCPLDEFTLVPQCFAPCPSTTETVSATTTTTQCAASSDCTNTVTATAPWGCRIEVAPSTTTSLIDCSGCVLETKTVPNAWRGRGGVCVGGRQTVTGHTGTATVTGCKVG